ncbi:hypothetical protein SLEP1_g6949 [Rubroshorea leprosula]|uniref:CBM20 domain-containing protein n=1 Tax=Rubroshorea leprosula TaxID=152421 RepID=A0AAV5HX63_9ROSI|nr:hypothetical protein SLEP1_g6949 [Rubroshorea leprosula]
MESLTKSLMKILPENCSTSNLSPPGSLLGQSEMPIPRSLKVKACFFHSLSGQRMAIKVSASPHFPSEGKVLRGLKTAGTAIRDPSKTVHVKFQLQKDCCFGEQFLLVGNEPILGSWNPRSAIPLNWSDGDIWTVELEIPPQRSIQFKFLLKQSTGDIMWQPGPDRIFRTWESKNTLVITEDWDNAEVQKINEETVVNKNEDLVVKPDSKTAVANAEAEDGSTVSSTDEFIAARRIISNKGLNTEDYSDEETLFTHEQEFPVLVPGLAPTSTEEGISREFGNQSLLRTQIGDAVDIQGIH